MMLNNSSMLNDTMDLNSNRSSFNTGRDGYFADDLHSTGSANSSQFTNPKFHTQTWTHAALHRDVSLENVIAKLVCQSYNLPQFTVRNYRVKVIENCKIFH